MVSTGSAYLFSYIMILDGHCSNTIAFSMYTINSKLSGNPARYSLLFGTRKFELPLHKMSEGFSIIQVDIISSKLRLMQGIN